MTVGLSFLLGIVQGLTEFLPISSSGHLVLVRSLFGVDLEESYLFFDLLLHLGTLVAVTVAFWGDIKELFFEFFRMARDRFRIRQNPNRRFIVLILISLLPMFLILPVKSKLDALFTSPRLVGFALLVTAALLFICDRVRKGRKTAKSATLLDALIIGLMQCIAIVPGLSRSGCTISGGVFRGFKRTFAVKFAFIMSIPVIFGANILSIPDAIAQIGDLSTLPIYLIGVAAAAVSGYFAIKLVNLLITGRGFTLFSIYCVIIGTVTLFVS